MWIKPGAEIMVFLFKTRGKFYVSIKYRIDTVKLFSPVVVQEKG